MWSDGCIQINPKATALISQAVTPFHGALNIFCSIPGAAPLRGLPRAMRYRPHKCGLLNSAHLRFAIHPYKLEFGRLSPRRQPWSSPCAQRILHHRAQHGSSPRALARFSPGRRPLKSIYPLLANSEPYFKTRACAGDI